MLGLLYASFGGTGVVGWRRNGLFGCQVVVEVLLGLLILFFCFGGTGAASLEVERVFCEFTVVDAGAVVSALAVPSLRV